MSEKSNKELMDLIMDRKKYIKVKLFNLPQMSAGVQQSDNFYEFRTWQATNPRVKILSTSIYAKINSSYNPSSPNPYQPTGMMTTINIPQMLISSQEILAVTYEDPNDYYEFGKEVR